MLITFPYGTKNQAVRQTRPMWTWVTSPPKQQTFLLPNTEPQSPGPGIPRADLSHSINRELLHWYPVNHGNARQAFDIGPQSFHMLRNTGYLGQKIDGPYGKCTAYRSQDNKYAPGPNSAFVRAEVDADYPTMGTSPDFTVSGWIRTTTAQRKGGLFREGTPWEYSNFYVDTYLSLNTRKTTHAWTTGATDLRDTGWRHCVVIKTADIGDVYVDAVLDGTATNHKTQTYTTGTDLVTRQICHPDSTYSIKTTDFCNLRVWRRALDQSEIKELYRNPWVGLAGSPVIIGTQEAGAAAGRNLTLLGVG